MTTPDDLDRSDMARLCNGGDSGLNSLMERHAEKLFHYLVRQLGNEQDAEDLGQESFVRVYQHRARFDPAQKFTTWLYTIATNLSRDRLRYRARHPNVSLEAEAENDRAGRARVRRERRQQATERTDDETGDENRPAAEAIHGSACERTGDARSGEEDRRPEPEQSAMSRHENERQRRNRCDELHDRRVDRATHPLGSA